MNQKQFTYFTWATVALSVLLPIYIWGDSYRWDISGLSIYQWFPLFGLLAWMIMATHYYTGVFRVFNPKLNKPKGYSRSTEYFVLAALLLHPGLLAFAQWQNGAGIPPTSYMEYVGEGLELAVLMGSFALILFLSYEVFNRLKNNEKVKRNWWMVSVSQTLAMILIFVHGLRLGTHLQSGWFLTVWFIYGVLLIPCFYIFHREEFKSLRS